MFTKSILLELINIGADRILNIFANIFIVLIRVCYNLISFKIFVYRLIDEALSVLLNIWIVRLWLFLRIFTNILGRT